VTVFQLMILWPSIPGQVILFTVAAAILRSEQGSACKRGYFVLLDNLITLHQAISITAGSQVISLSYRGWGYFSLMTAAITAQGTIGIKANLFI
jgi:hypothetical protein